MTGRPSIQHVHRASIPARPPYRMNRRRMTILAGRDDGPLAMSKPANQMLGLVYGLPLSLVLWVSIAAAVHFG